MIKKLNLLIFISLLSILLVACDSKEEKEDLEKNDDVVIESATDNDVEEREYLIDKYFKLEKGISFDNAMSKLNDTNLVINDNGEYEATAGYKKREVSIVDGENKLDLVFRDNKLGSKTFTYDTDETNSTWFYSNYYDILDNKEVAEEAHGIWIDAVKSTDFSDEYEMNIYLQDNDV